MSGHRAYRLVCVAALYLLVAEIVLSPLIWDLMLNGLGPSTEFYDPKIVGAQALPNGAYAATVGDKIYITYTVVRHALNGSCFERVWRYAQNVGGPQAGRQHLLDAADLQFVGENELRHPRWPLDGLVLTNDLLPPGVNSQKLDFYNVARYWCNALDYVWPRYLQGGEPNQTVGVQLVLKRKP